MFDKILNVTNEEKKQIEQEIVEKMRIWLESPFYVDLILARLTDNDRFIRLLIEKINNVQLNGGRNG